MQDPDYFRKLQKAYYKNYCKSFDIQSSQILFTAFHPCYQQPYLEDGESDYVLMLEQIFTPQDQDYIILDERKNINTLKVSNLNSNNPEKNVSDFKS